MLAWRERRQRGGAGARVLKAARATLASVGVSHRARRLRTEGALAEQVARAAADPRLLREAILLHEVLSPPRAARRRSVGGPR